ncbi:transmembrane and coiled-coil domain-containing protein 6 isoform X2 [Pyxicephalus adspersus]|uniref:transmembrane and coiled-coil domain-containing protein 6 isoform X2 n=1 Tax=Pyxicephalus adspersus TaxID=30357 RepID=UPI003B596486
MWCASKRIKKSQLTLEDLRVQRREREKALRKARREQHLTSKRLLRDQTDEEAFLGGNLSQHLLSEQQVLQRIRDIQHGSDEKLKHLTVLRHALRNRVTQLLFIRAEGSMQFLIGLFTCQFARIQMEAARCLHELSHSNDPAVSKACLPATSYLVTFLSGSSAELMELCLYTLGNLSVESEAARHQLLLQGIIPAFSMCLQSPYVTVLEATGYALSQLLQAKEAPQSIVPTVLEAGLTQDILKLLLSDFGESFGMMIEFAWCLHYIISRTVLEAGLTQDILKLLLSDFGESFGMMIEFAWCLHYIISSQVNNVVLISQGTVPKLVHMLTKLTTSPYLGVSGSELLICPLVRCLGNLLTEVDGANKRAIQEDGRVIVALFFFIQKFQQEHLFVIQECLWTLNNMTAKDPIICSAVLHFKLIPVFLQLLGHSRDIVLLVAKNMEMLSALKNLETYKDCPEAQQHIQAVWNYCKPMITEHDIDGQLAME